MHKAAGFLAASLFCSMPLAAQDGLSFTAEQAEQGRDTYREMCQICHGSSLANGQFGTPLRGKFFRNNWQGKNVGELLQFIYEKMPPDDIMSLTPEQSAGLLAYIFSRNDIEAGTAPLSGETASQRDVPLPFQ